MNNFLVKLKILGKIAPILLSIAILPVNLDLRGILFFYSIDVKIHI